MSWTWKQCLADQILQLVNSRKSADFSISDVYAWQGTIEERFPNNRNIREKIRQTLQRLRNDDFLLFLGGGDYRLNFNFNDLQMEAVKREDDGIVIPETRRVVRYVRLRDTLLACDVKRRYEYRCQVCREAVPLVKRVYAECHHLKPLGTPHLGPDIEGNLLVLCPNHHIMFDRGALAIEPTSLLVRHATDAIKPCRLFVLPWHSLKVSYLEYHLEHIFGNV